MFKYYDDTLNFAQGVHDQEANHANQPSITDQGRQPKGVSVSNGPCTDMPDVYIKGTSKSAYSLSKSLENEFINLQKNMSAEEGTIQRTPCYQFVDPWHADVHRHDPMMDCSVFLRNDYRISNTHSSSAQQQKWISKYSDALLSSALDFILSSHLNNVPLQNLSKHHVYRPLPVYPVSVVSQGRSESYSSMKHCTGYRSGMTNISSESQFFNDIDTCVNKSRNFQMIVDQTAVPQPLNCLPVRKPSICTQPVSCHPIKSQPVNSKSVNCQSCDNPADGCQSFSIHSSSCQPPNIQADSCQPFYNQLARCQEIHSQTIGNQLAKSHPVTGHPVTEEQRKTQQNNNAQYSFHSYDPKLKIQEPFMSFMIDKGPTSESAFTMIHTVNKPETKPFPYTHRMEHSSSRKQMEELSAESRSRLVEGMDTQSCNESTKYMIGNLNTVFEAASEKRGHKTSLMTMSSSDVKIENILQKDQSTEDQEVELLTSKKNLISTSGSGFGILSEINSKEHSCSTADDTNISQIHSKSENTGRIEIKIEKPNVFLDEKGGTSDKALTQERKSQKKTSKGTKGQDETSECEEHVTKNDANIAEEKSFSHDVQNLGLWKYTSVLVKSPYKERPSTDEVINISNEMFLADLNVEENVENKTTDSGEDSSNCSDVIPYAGQLDHGSYCKPVMIPTSETGCPITAINEDTSDTDTYDESPDKTLLHSPMSGFHHSANNGTQEVRLEYGNNENSRYLQEIPVERVDASPKENTITDTQYVSDQLPTLDDTSILHSDKCCNSTGPNTKNNIEDEMNSKQISEQNSKGLPSSKRCPNSSASRSSFPIKPKLMMIKKYEESYLKNEDASFCHRETPRGSSQTSEDLQQCRNGTSSLFSDTAVQFVEKEYQMHLSKSFDSRQKQKWSKSRRLSKDAVKTPSSQKRKKTVSEKCKEPKSSKKLKPSYTVNNAETSFSSESDQQTLTCPEDLEHCEAFHWCHVCEKTVKTEEDSVRHVKLHGNGASANLNYYYLQVYGCVTKHWRGYNKAEKCVYLCGLCEKTIPYIKGFKRHIMRHGCGVFCSLCDKSFEDEETLKKHKKSHQEEKPYHCSECNRSYSTKGSFNMHRHSHHVTDTFECMFCGKVLSSKGSLTTHTRLHTGDNPYKCRLCDRSYPQNVQLKLHMKAHQRLGEI